MSESMTVHIIARIRSDFGAKFGHPAPKRAGGQPDGPRDIRTGISKFRRASRAGRVQPSLADLAVFPVHGKGLVAHGEAAQAGRQPAHGRFCHAIAVSAQSYRPVLRAAGANRNGPRAGARFVRMRRRPDGRHPDLGYQALSALYRQPSGCAGRLCPRSTGRAGSAGLCRGPCACPAGQAAGASRYAGAGPRPGYQHEPGRVYGRFLPAATCASPSRTAC